MTACSRTFAESGPIRTGQAQTEILAMGTVVGRCSSLRGNYFPCVFEYSSKCCWLHWDSLFCFPAELPRLHTGAVAQLEMDQSNLAAAVLGGIKCLAAGMGGLNYIIIQDSVLTSLLCCFARVGNSTGCHILGASYACIKISMKLWHYSVKYPNLTCANVQN